MQCDTPFITRKDMKWNERVTHGYANIVLLPSPNNFFMVDMITSSLPKDSRCIPCLINTNLSDKARPIMVQRTSHHIANYTLPACKQ